MIEGMTKEGVDHEALLNLYCKVYNDCLEGKPSDMVAGLHLCRGNFKVSRSLVDVQDSNFIVTGREAL